MLATVSEHITNIYEWDDLDAHMTDLSFLASPNFLIPAYLILVIWYSWIKRKALRHGKQPKMRKRIIPGIRKLGNGECSKMDKGNPLSNLPDGEMIKKKPPHIALNPRNNNNEMRAFLAIIDLIII